VTAVAAGCDPTSPSPPDHVLQAKTRTADWATAHHQQRPPGASGNPGRPHRHCRQQVGGHHSRPSCAEPGDSRTTARPAAARIPGSLLPGTITRVQAFLLWAASSITRIVDVKAQPISGRGTGKPATLKPVEPETGRW
jgi:hypothetical protein